MVSSLGLREWTEALSVLKHSASSCPDAPKWFQLLRKDGAPRSAEHIAPDITVPKTTFPHALNMQLGSVEPSMHTNQRGDPAFSWAPINTGIS